MLDNSRSKAIPYALIANTDEDRFLFCLTLPKFEFDCCCGLSLRTGVLFISLFFVFSGMGSFYTVFFSTSNFDYYSAFGLLVAYLLGFILLGISAFTYLYQFAYSAYLIYSLILLINFGEVVGITIMIFIGLYIPNGNENAFVKGMSFLLVGFLLSFIFAYFIWIIFSYAMHLKYKRVGVIKGIFDEDALTDDINSNYNEIN